MNLLDRMTLRPAQEFVDEYGLGSGGGAPAGFEAPPAAAPAVYAPMDVPEDYSWSPAPDTVGSVPVLDLTSFPGAYQDVWEQSFLKADETGTAPLGFGADQFIGALSSGYMVTPAAVVPISNKLVDDLKASGMPGEEAISYGKTLRDSLRVQLPADFVALSAPPTPAAATPAAATPAAATPAAATAAAPSGAASDPYGFEGRTLQETPAPSDAIPAVGKTGLLPSFASRLEARRALTFKRAADYESAINDPKVPETLKNTAKAELGNLQMTLSEFETQIAKDNAAAKVGMADNQEALMRAEAALSKLGPDSQERIEAATYVSKAKAALNDPDQVGYATKALDEANRILTKENRAFVRFTTANQAAVRASATLDDALKIPGAAAKFGSQAANAKALYEEAQDPELGYEDRATRMTLARGEIAKVSLDIEAAAQGRKDPPFGGIYRQNLLDQPTSEISGSSVALYLSVFGAIAGPVLAAQESKKNRQFQMDLYNLQRQNAREDLQWQYDLRKAYGEDSASVAAAQASAGKAAAAPVSKANINLSKAKVKVS